MGMFKLMIATTFASVLLVGMPTMALADSASQTKEVDCETTTGSYGQTTTKCKTEVIPREGVKPVKVLEKTGLDTSTLTLALGSIATGAVAAITKRKLNA